MTRATPEQLQPLVAGWLPNQRWFAGKGREASVDVTPLAVLSATSPQVTIWRRFWRKRWTGPQSRRIAPISWS